MRIICWCWLALVVATFSGRSLLAQYYEVPPVKFTGPLSNPKYDDPPTPFAGPLSKQTPTSPASVTQVPNFVPLALPALFGQEPSANPIFAVTLRELLAQGSAPCPGKGEIEIEFSFPPGSICPIANPEGSTCDDGNWIRDLVQDCLKVWQHLWVRGNYREAEQLAEKAARLEPTNVEALHAHVVAQIVNGLGNPGQCTRSLPCPPVNCQAPNPVRDALLRQISAAAPCQAPTTQVCPACPSELACPVTECPQDHLLQRVSLAISYHLGDVAQLVHDNVFAFVEPNCCANECTCSKKSACACAKAASCACATSCGCAKPAASCPCAAAKTCACCSCAKTKMAKTCACCSCAKATCACGSKCACGATAPTATRSVVVMPGHPIMMPLPPPPPPIPVYQVMTAPVVSRPVPAHPPMVVQGQMYPQPIPMHPPVMVQQPILPPPMPMFVPVSREQPAMKRVRLETPQFEAQCNKMTCVAGGDVVLLEGDVQLMCRRPGAPMRVEAHRVRVYLHDGTFVVESAEDISVQPVVAPPAPVRQRLIIPPAVPATSAPEDGDMR